MSVRIDYSGVALGAKADFKVSVSEQANVSKAFQLEKSNLVFHNYGNPCELYSVLLDGGAWALPPDSTTLNVGWWSEQLSGDDGKFGEIIYADFVADNLYTSNGIYLTFDTFNGIFANDIDIIWKKGGETVSTKNFKPDSPAYFCHNKVELYDEVVIFFKSINMPYNRLKLHAIDYGMHTSFDGSELKRVKIIQEINPISSDIAVNTCDFMIHSKRDIEFIFEEMQPVKVYFDNQLKSASFIKSSTRKSDSVWLVETEDYIGLMDKIPYFGGVYTNKNAVELMQDIFSTAKVPCQIEGTFSDLSVSGYIPYTTCREALMQVAFAVQASVDTSNVDFVKVFSPNNNIVQKIPLNRIMQGQDFSTPSAVTSVEVVSHTYSKTDEEATLYENISVESYDNVFLEFSEPVHDLVIVAGEIISSSENHAVINASAGCTLKGKKYNHTTTTKTKSNMDVLQTNSENVISVKNATLVSDANVDKILESCYNYYINNKTINLKIVDGKHELSRTRYKYGTAKYGQFKYGAFSQPSGVEYDTPTNVGDMIACETAYLGELNGRILKQTFSLNGGIIMKDTVLKRT